MGQDAFLTGLSMPEGFRLLAFDEIDSTNDEARRQIDSGTESGLWIVARRQSNGRGRRGRSWISPDGNLFASLLLRPHVPLSQAAQMSFVAALAVHDALSSLTGDAARFRLKWPNDVLLDGRKLAGILLESASSGRPGARSPETNWVIIGLGVNSAGFPPDVEFPATSLKAATGRDFTCQEVFGAVSLAMAHWLDHWRSAGFGHIRAEWKYRAAGVGEVITVRLESETLSGHFQDLNERGELILRLDAGEIQIVSAGDVFFPHGVDQGR